MAYIDRDQFIALLERLGSDRDSDVLAAAREIHRTLHEAGIDWNDLLIADEDEEEDDEDEDRLDEEDEYEADEDDDFEDDDEEEYEYEDDDDASSSDEDDEPVDDTDDDRAMIERILRDFKISEDTRDDLKDLKDDIDEGLFTLSDRRYLHALLARLEGQK